MREAIKLKGLILVQLLFFCFLNSYAQTKLFVSTDGNDNNNGSITKPFKTLRQATATAEKKKGDVQILLKSGTYYLDTTIAIFAENFLCTSLVINSYKNSTVNISAGSKLQLQWKHYNDNIYKAAVPDNISFERLYVNEKLQVLARYPNYDSSARIFNGTTADAISPQRIKHWKNPVNGYVHALHEYEWGGFHYKITGVDSNGNLQLLGGWQNNRPAGMHKQYRFVENIFEELDAPGEWFLDQSNRTLYYYPPRNVNLSTALIEVSHLKNSIELHGTDIKPLKKISIENLHFIHNERTFMETKEPLVRSDWTIYRGGAILLEGTENCSITDCSFTGIGGNAIMISNYNKHDTISGCHISYIGANAICFIGDSKSLRSPSFRYEDYILYDKLDKTPGPLANNYPQQCIVTNNLLHNLGEIEKQATGVEIEMSSQITVRHNTIYSTPRAGINIGDGAFGGHIIEYNDVFNTVLETGDHGAFNSWGRDRYWSPDRKYMDSIVAIHPELILLDAQKQTIIRNNRFRCDHGWDIDLDDGSGNYHIYNNVCLNGGLKLREGFYRIVENNILINNSFHPHVWFKNSGDIFMHNIVMKSYFPIQINYWGKEVDHNLFPDSVALLEAQSSGTDKNSIEGNPLFTDASAGNYTVQKNSPALKIGFKNFAMDEFGVQKAYLKKIALHPAIPMLAALINKNDKAVVSDFLGGKIKSVNGLGERSAFGLPDENGVIIISAEKTSLLSTSGLQSKDVIRVADGKAIKTVEDLNHVFNTANNKPFINIQIIRNHQIIHTRLFLK